MKIIDSSFHNNKKIPSHFTQSNITKFPGAVSRTETLLLILLLLLNHLGNYINFYHVTVTLEFRFYSKDGPWKVRPKY